MSEVSNIHLIAIPAHHVKDIEDPIGVAVDTVKDGVTVSNPTICKNEEIANIASFRIHISQKDTCPPGFCCHQVSYWGRS